MYSKKVIQRLLTDVAKRKITPGQAFERLRDLPYEALGFAHLDHHRHLRKGFPEVVYTPGKRVNDLKKIALSFKKSKVEFILTRIEEPVVEKLRATIPELVYNKSARVAYLRKKRRSHGTKGMVTVITAGSCDIPVADEAAVTLEIMGHRVERIYDCGVAGLHRLLDHLPKLKRAKAVICVAGMEGALPSVLGGLIDKPIIAVPTSVGYGTSFSGISALLTMLNACSQGIAVVNIDNGFGAAMFAALIARS
ncbi:MAG: nickel pincer cofactor biosynthesis protein LarB [Candidatus Omnitrophica bacterium]|nr:nickel pincer cofactor biosynthesis protein LarB [Candidatus Omnitrophota bacterium]